MNATLKVERTYAAGYTHALIQAVEEREQGVVPDTSVICGAVVATSAQGRGIAGDTLMALRRAARDTAGLNRVIVPVRPTAKTVYPLVPIESYLTWRRDDGEAFDPWVRTHERVGARIRGGLSVLRIDRSTDEGVYREPNIWMQHV